MVASSAKPLRSKGRMTTDNQETKGQIIFQSPLTLKNSILNTKAIHLSVECWRKTYIRDTSKLAIQPKKKKTHKENKYNYI